MRIYVHIYIHTYSMHVSIYIYSLCIARLQYINVYHESCVMYHMQSVCVCSNNCNIRVSYIYIVTRIHAHTTLNIEIIEGWIARTEIKICWSCSNVPRAFRQSTPALELPTCRPMVCTPYPQKEPCNRHHAWLRSPTKQAGESGEKVGGICD